MRHLLQTIRDLWKDPMGRVGIIGVLLLILLAVIAPLAAPYDPEQMVAMPKLAPCAEHWFGTDNYGRDIFSRILYGARVSLEVGIIAVGIGATAGYVLGLVAGYFEGPVDRVIMCVMDILFAFPSILLAIFISAKGLEYVSNARSVGVRTGAILSRHISPNVVAPFTVQATLALSSAILTEASMSFLGLGIQPPDPSWGSMLSEARSYMEQAPWTALFPILFIVVTILLFNILGDSLRDVLDPKLKT